jgi:predicted metallopeptidase
MEDRVKKSLWIITVIAVFFNLDQITCYTLSIVLDGAGKTKSYRFVGVLNKIFLNTSFLNPQLFTLMDRA